MNRLEQLFQQKSQNVLAVYFTAGFPELESTRKTLLELAAAGADLIEIGMPFSDPLADGPTIQESSKEALQNGMSIVKLFRQLEGIRNETQVPLVLMGYLNPVLSYGVEQFCISCKEVGVDGVILPDLPLEYFRDNYKEIFRKHGIFPIFLVSPLTLEKRIRELDRESRGFLYAVSSSSTTGGKGGFGPEQIAYFEQLSAYGLNNPVIVGFGISDNEAFSSVCNYVNGGIVGSAFIRAQERGVSVSAFVQGIRGKT